jgi:hypothetical protein
MLAFQAEVAGSIPAARTNIAKAINLHLSIYNYQRWTKAVLLKYLFLKTVN